MNVIRTLSECIGLLSIQGFNTKAEVREKIIALRRELEEEQRPKSVEERIQRAFERDEGFLDERD